MPSKRTKGTKKPQALAHPAKLPPFIRSPTEASSSSAFNVGEAAPPGSKNPTTGVYSLSGINVNEKPELQRLEKPPTEASLFSHTDTDGSATSSYRSAEPYQHQILYKLICLDNTSHHHERQIERYSETPFAGQEIAENRRLLSVMDVVVVKKGIFPSGIEPPRTDQAREEFGTTNLADKERLFIGGHDFIPYSDLERAVVIMSPFVIDFLKDGLKYYPDGISDDCLWIEEPYRVLAYNYTRLSNTMEPVQSGKGQRRTPSEAVGYKHLKVVLDWFQPYYKEQIKPEAHLHKSREATFKNLWLLYKPGTIVYTKKCEHIECYVVHSLHHPVPKQTWLWNLSLWRFDFDTNRLVRRSKAKMVEISSFLGKKKFDKLPFLPVQFLENDMKEKLIDRGRDHCRLIHDAPILRHYDGDLNGNNPLRYSGAVIVDPLTYVEKQRSTSTLTRMVRPVDYDDPSASREPLDHGGGEVYSGFNGMLISSKDPFDDEDMYLLLPAGKIRGFALGKKEWLQFDIATLKEPRDSINSAFDNLIMDNTDKGSLKALAISPATASTNFGQVDFIGGKGLGKVILLHGPPGVGKSFTVECLSQDLKKPLLVLTSTDIGTNPSTIEEKLSSWLGLAHRWGAMVLLDEADTFLERRDPNNLSRNALVDVFLRVLEYFPGMIFLTTNQPGFIDEAVISRVSLCIEYPPPTKETRKEIWKKFFSMYLDVDSQTIKIKETVRTTLISDPEIIDLPLTGRDIRNVIHSAIEIAACRKNFTNSKSSDAAVEVREDDFKMALKNKAAFYNYLRRLGGRTEAERAEDRGARVEPF